MAQLVQNDAVNEHTEAETVVAPSPLKGCKDTEEVGKK